MFPALYNTQTVWLTGSGRRQLMAKPLRPAAPPLQLLTNSVAYPTAVVPRTLTTLRNRFIQLTATMPVVLPPASSSATCEPGYCSWSIPSIFNLETRAWTDDTQFTVVNVGPFFLVPVGGLYRMQMTTARIVEPPSPTSTKPGYPVTRHLILFDEDLRNVSGGGSAEEGKGCKRVLWGSPEAEAHARVVLGAGSPRRR
jgi:hypothetical protein